MATVPSAQRAQSRARKVLSMNDDVEAAPSIGPVMAERLSAFGVRTIGDLLASDATAIVASLGDKRITDATVRDWQAQTTLVLDIPGLRGSQAQLLVGAGYRSAAAIAGAAEDTLCADVLNFAGTDAGRRILREGAAPDIEVIVNWSRAAREQLAA
jgi:nucleotidyltransferase/DNA polymerase involved in DNA repair